MYIVIYRLQSDHNFKEEHLKITKKMILIQCHTGMRFDDIKKIRPNNINDDILKFTPGKTAHHGIVSKQHSLNAPKTGAGNVLSKLKENERFCPGKPKKVPKESFDNKKKIAVLKQNGVPGKKTGLMPKNRYSQFNSYNNIVLPEVTFNRAHNQTACLV